MLLRFRPFLSLYEVTISTYIEEVKEVIFWQLVLHEQLETWRTRKTKVFL